MEDEEQKTEKSVSGRFNVDFKDVINWIIAILGVLVGVFSAIANYKNGFYTAFVSTLVTQLLLCAMLLYHLNALRTYRRIIEEKENRCIQLEQKEKEAADKLSAQLESEEKMKSDYNNQVKVMAVSIKNASKLYNDFCTRIPKLSDSSYHIIEVLENGNVEEEVKKDELIRALDEYSNAMVGLYELYTVNLLEECIKVISAYLKTRNLRYDIALTVKLFNKAYDPLKDHRSTICVYTSFRDKNTKDKTDREVGGVSYTIDGNADFVQCLTKEYFIINNAKKESDSYSNEHAEFERYYNCTAVVPIKTKLPNGGYIFFGYLCCDCLNNDENITDIMDKVCANFLYAMAQLYSTFVETLDSNWKDRTDSIDVQQKSFIEVIYAKTFKGNKDGTESGGK